MTPKPEERLRVKEWFDASGLSITAWAAEHGFRREQVYAFLNGRTTGRRGAAHRIAVALKLKVLPGPLDAGTTPPHPGTDITSPTIKRSANETNPVT